MEQMKEKAEAGDARTQTRVSEKQMHTEQLLALFSALLVEAQSS